MIFLPSFGDAKEFSLVKISDKGVTEWNRTYGEFWYPSRVEQTADGGYILAEKRSDGIALLKTDSNGIPQWNTTYGGDFVVFVHQVQEGGYVVAIDDLGQLHLIRTDSAGIMMSNHTYETSNMTAISATATSDGGYVIAEYVGSNPASACNLLLTEIAGNGTILWQQTYGGNWINPFPLSGPVGPSIEETSDGGYIIAGTRVLPPAIHDPLLLKVDGRGTMQWIKSTFEETVQKGDAFSVVESPDSGYLVAGSSSYGLFITKIAASPTYAPPLPLFASLVVAAVLESVALVLLAATVVKRKVRHRA